ncbi:hypothetical protein [Streptomyces sp. NPDC029554]|uniref:hypothetical protein n=1 Tax=Streptomyces sp. NPDC029554 TaxID=3155126 RepID=UPI0033CBFFF4
MRDSDPALPVACAADAGHAGQHGFEIVMAVAALRGQREPVGKRITARIALLDVPETSPDAALSSACQEMHSAHGKTAQRASSRERKRCPA